MRDIAEVLVWATTEGLGITAPTATHPTAIAVFTDRTIVITTTGTAIMVTAIAASTSVAGISVSAIATKSSRAIEAAHLQLRVEVGGAMHSVRSPLPNVRTVVPTSGVELEPSPSIL